MERIHELKQQKAEISETLETLLQPLIDNKLDNTNYSKSFGKIEVTLPNPDGRYYEISWENGEPNYMRHPNTYTYLYSRETAWHLQELKEHLDGLVKVIRRVKNQQEEEYGEENVSFNQTIKTLLAKDAANELEDMADETLEELLGKELSIEDKDHPVRNPVEMYESLLDQTRRKLDLKDIEGLIQTRESIVGDILSSNTEDTEAVGKWFKTFNLNEKEFEDNEIDILHSGIEYLLIRCGQKTFKKHGKPPEEYKAAWVIGIDREQPSGFFIHRLEWCKEIVDDDFEWDKREIRKQLGFNVDFQGGEIEEGETYRIQGDITLTRKDEYSFQDYKEFRAEQKVKDEVEIPESVITEAAEEHLPMEHEDIDFRKVFHSKYGFNLKLDCISDTEYLKSFQKIVDVSEDTVRSRQEDRGLQRLHPSTRCDIIEEVLTERVQESINEHIDIEQLYKDKKYEWVKDMEERLRQRNYSIGSHLIMVGEAIRPSYRPWRNRNPYENDNTEEVEFLVASKTKLTIVHDEHSNTVVDLEPGIYGIDALNRNQNAR